MPFFRKKPVVIEAMHYDGSRDSSKEIVAWAAGQHGASLTAMVGGTDPHLLIRTAEGDMRADPGDMVIRGVEGEFYPCKPSIFEATYEPYEEDDDTLS